MAESIIVTGYGGQSGYLMANYLFENTDYNIIACSSPTSNTWPKLRVLDITDQEQTEILIKQVKPSFFLNFAGKTEPQQSWDDPASYFSVNVLGVINQLEAIRKHAPNCRYFNAGSVMQKEKTISDPYTASKIAANEIVDLYRRSYGIFAAQGILDRHESQFRKPNFVSQKIISNLFRINESLKKAESFAPFKLGNIHSIINWAYAQDFVEGIWEMMDAKEPYDYEFSSFQTFSVKDFVNETCRQLGIEAEWVGSDFNEKLVIPNYVSDIGDVKSQTLIEVDDNLYFQSSYTQLDIKKTMEDLNWMPKTNFNGIISKLLEAKASEKKI
jgi:GDPmannose 4,6-dehydratase